MNSMSRRLLLLLTLASLGLVSPAPIQAWQLDDLGLKHVAIISALHLNAETNSTDFDEDERRKGVSENFDSGAKRENQGT
jgi:hypothetical protein